MKRAVSLWPGLLLVLLSGCGYYSFSGASIPAHLTTIAIPLAEDRSSSPIAILDETLTELLVDRFVRQTRLSLVENEDEADIVLTAQITRYNNATYLSDGPGASTVQPYHPLRLRAVP